MLIPRSKIRLVQDIDRVLAATHSPNEIQRFKCLVRKASRRFLDPSVAFGSQDPGRLLDVRKDVLQNDAKMSQYLHQWPVDAYSKIWSQCYRWRIANPRRPPTGNKSTYRRIITANIKRGKTRHSVDSARWSKSHKVRTAFVGRPPPGHNLAQKTEQRTDRRDQEKDSEGEDELALTPFRCQNSLSVKSSESTSSSLSAPNSGTQSAHQPLTTLNLSERYPSPCAFCNFLPAISDGIRSELLKLFSDIPHVVSRLESSGLVHNLHLEMLLRWDREDRQEFCNRLPQNHFSTLDLIMITTRLLEQPQSGSKSLVMTSTNVQGEQQQTKEEKCEKVPWPDDNVKNLLMTSPDILVELKRAMGPHGSDELLTRLIQLVDQHGAAFLEHYRPYEQKSSVRLNDTVKTIVKAEQRLCRFEDAWPIRFYLLRRAHCQSQKTPPSNRTTTNAPPDLLKALKPPMAEGTQILTGPECPIHLQPDLTRLSESIIKFFSERHSQELLIPLALIGVTTDQQFTILRSMSHEQVESLITRTDHYATRASLNLFQSVLLKVLLRD